MTGFLLPEGYFFLNEGNADDVLQDLHVLSCCLPVSMVSPRICHSLQSCCSSQLPLHLRVDPPLSFSSSSELLLLPVLQGSRLLDLVSESTGKGNGCGSAHALRRECEASLNPSSYAGATLVLELGSPSPLGGAGVGRGEPRGFL